MERELFPLVYGEAEEIVPGHVELVNVLWEMGIQPDLRMLPDVPVRYPPSLTREAAVQAALVRFGGEQWARWPLGEELEARIQQTVERTSMSCSPKLPTATCPAGSFPAVRS